MNGDGGNFPPPQSNGGDFLLSLLQKPHLQPSQPPTIPPLQSLTIDPAVAMMGPTIPISTSPYLTNGHDHPNLNYLPHHPHPNFPPWSHTPSPYTQNIFGLTHNPFSLPQIPETHYPNTNPLHFNNGVSLAEDLRRLGFPIEGNNNSNSVNSFIHQQQQQHQLNELKLQFGSLPTVSFANSSPVPSNGNYNGFDRNNNNQNHNHNHDAVDYERRGVIGNFRSTGISTEQIRVPPRFVNDTRGKGYWGSEVGEVELNGRNENLFRENVRIGFGERSNNSRGNVGGGHELRLPDQIDHPGPPSGSKLHSDVVVDDDIDAVGEQLADSLLLEDELDDKSSNSRRRRGPRDKVNNT